MLPRINLTYDFSRRPYDTVDWWRTLSGTPATSGGILQMNQGSAIMQADFQKGNLSMRVYVPNSPTAGDLQRRWGWKNNALGTYAYFESTGATFQGSTCDRFGNVQTSAITWNSAWTSAATEYTILWDASGFTFLINNVKMAKISALTGVPLSVLSPFIENNVNDTLGVAYFDIAGAQTIFYSPYPDNVTAPAKTFNIGGGSPLVETLTVTENFTELDRELLPGIVDTLTNTESVTVRISPPVSVVDTLTNTEGVTVSAPFFPISVSDALTITESKTVSAPA